MFQVHATHITHDEGSKDYDVLTIWDGEADVCCVFTANGKVRQAGQVRLARKGSTSVNDSMPRHTEAVRNKTDKRNSGYTAGRTESDKLDTSGLPYRELQKILRKSGCERLVGHAVLRGLLEKNLPRLFEAGAGDEPEPVAIEIINVDALMGDDETFGDW